MDEGSWIEFDRCNNSQTGLWATSGALLLSGSVCELKTKVTGVEQSERVMVIETNA